MGAAGVAAAAPVVATAAVDPPLGAAAARLLAAVLGLVFGWMRVVAEEVAGWWLGANPLVPFGPRMLLAAGDAAVWVLGDARLRLRLWVACKLGVMLDVVWGSLPRKLLLGAAPALPAAGMVPNSRRTMLTPSSAEFNNAVHGVCSDHDAALHGLSTAAGASCMAQHDKKRSALAVRVIVASSVARRGWLLEGHALRNKPLCRTCP